MRIDIHTHILPEKWEGLAAKYGGGGWPRLAHEGNCRATIYLGDKPFRKITDQCFDPRRRLEDMRREGLDRQLLSPIPVLFCYWAKAEAAAEFARIQNDNIAEVVAKHPERFLGAGTVPLQDVDLAVQELERIVRDLRFPVVEIGTNVNGRNLDDPGLFPFFRRAAELNVSLFVHPWDVLGRERMTRYYFPHLVGMGGETALAISSLIFGGIIDRLPTLDFCFGHGGGSFPYLLPRIDHGWRERPEGQAAIPRSPSEYARGFYYDSIVHGPAVLQYLVQQAGEDRILLGSDYPFDMGVAEPVKALEATPGLTAQTKRKILGENALRFLHVA